MAREKLKAKRKPGRPRLPEDGRKATTYVFKCTAAEKQKIKAFAESMGQLHTVWSRETLLKATES